MRDFRSRFLRTMRIAAAILSAGAAGACAEPEADRPARATTHQAPRPLPPVSDYAVYATVLRENFVTPPAEDHADGLPTCLDSEPLDSLIIEANSRFRLRGGAFQDSALTAELSPDGGRLLVALRALDSRPRSLFADSLQVGVPVRTAPARANGGLQVDVITLSRVAYDGDSTTALVHVTRPCRVEPGPDPEEEPGPQGLSALSLLRWNGAAWTVSEVVYLEME